jgi:hypothetical protein
MPSGGAPGAGWRSDRRSGKNTVLKAAYKAELLVEDKAPFKTGSPGDVYKAGGGLKNIKVSEI